MKRIKQLSNPFYLLLFLTVCICFSCSDDEDLNPVQRLDAHFPVEDYQTNSSIVYKNAVGREITFSISSLEGSTDTVYTIQDSLCLFQNLSPDDFFTSFSVLGEYTVFSLRDENDPAYSVCFRMTLVRESIEDELVLGANNALNVFVGERILPGPTGNYPFGTFLWLGAKFKSVFNFVNKPSGQDVELLGQNFVDVFDVEWEGNDGITKMYINADLGMLAFLDEVNDLYVWDRYE